MVATFDGVVPVTSSAVLCEQGDWISGWAWYLADGDVRWCIAGKGGAHTVAAAGAGGHAGPRRGRRARRRRTRGHARRRRRRARATEPRRASAAGVGARRRVPDGRLRAPVPGDRRLRAPGHRAARHSSTSRSRSGRSRPSTSTPSSPVSFGTNELARENVRQSLAVVASRDGDVRARRRHVAHERVDLGGRARSQYDGQRRAVGDRARGARLGCVHPHQQQGRRLHRPQARVCARPVRVRDRRRRDDGRAEPHGDHHLLGAHRWPGSVAPVARDAVADSRQLRRRGPHEGVRVGRRGRRYRGRGRPAARRVRDDVPLVARRFRARGGDHRRGVVGQPARPRREIHRPAPVRRGRRRALRHRDGWHRARHSRLARRRRIRRAADGARRQCARVVCLVARQTEACRDTRP